MAETSTWEELGSLRG